MRGRVGAVVSLSVALAVSLSTAPVSTAQPTAPVSIAPRARPAPPMEPTVNRWTWNKPPDEAKLRATIADMRQVVAEHPDVARAHGGGDMSIVISAVRLDGARFSFPGNMGEINFVVSAGKSYGELVTRCLAAAQAHFTSTDLTIKTSALDELLQEDPHARDYLEYDDDGDVGDVSGDDAYMSRGRHGRFGVGMWGWLYPVAMIALFYFLIARSRGGGASWGSYYLFWFIAPMAISFVSRHPLVLLAIPVALVARRWLPDPYQFFKYSGRIRSLDSQVRANPANLTARRDLAVIWLERRRPLRALPLLDEALARDPDSSELHFLRGVALLHARRWQEAVDPLIEACRLDSRMRYGEPYLRAADALMALRRWEDAEEALGHYTTVSRSSVEGSYKLGLVRRARGDDAGARKAFDEAKQSYRDSPAFHRRRNLGWYLRARLRS